MTNTPKVSICIPAYRQTNYLSKTLESIISQEYTDYEVIITDDSPDDSVEDLVKRYDFKGRLKYIRNTVRKGTPANWNEAISHAKGEYIKLLHHDDWFADCKSLYKYVDLLENNPESDFAFSGCISILGDKQLSIRVSYESIVALNRSPLILILGNIIGSPSVTIYRRKITQKFDEKLKWLVDVEFYLRILIYNSRFEYTPSTLMNICSRGSHQVTNECFGNGDIELPEYLYLFNKYLTNHKLDTNQRKLLQELYVKFNIRSINDLTSLNLISEIPESVVSAFSKTKVLKTLLRKRMIEIYKKMKKEKNKLFQNNAFKRSYSQSGEDLIMEYIFDCLHIDKPSFIDVGAHHPFRLSNTALFYKKGCHCINVEPNPYLIEEFQRYRKKDVNLNFGIAGKNDELIFYIMSAPTMSTFSLQEATRLERETSLRIVGERKILVKHIQSVIDDFSNGVFPDCLSLDVEGLEDEILRSIDFEKNYPKVICLETLSYTENNEEIKEFSNINFLLEKGYFVYGETYINTIFVKDSIWKIRGINETRNY